MKTIKVLWLLDDLTLGLAWHALENWDERLSSWNHLSSRFLGGVYIFRYSLVILAVIVNEWGSKTDIAFLWSGSLTIVLKVALFVDVLVVIDLLDQLELDSVPNLIGLIVLSPILVIAIVPFHLLTVLHLVNFSLLAISGAWALSQLAAEAIRRVAELIRRSLRRNVMAELRCFLLHVGCNFINFYSSVRSH